LLFFQEIDHLEAIQQTSDGNIVECRTQNKTIMFYSSRQCCVLLYRLSITIPCDTFQFP